MIYKNTYKIYTKKSRTITPKKIGQNLRLKY